MKANNNSVISSFRLVVFILLIIIVADLSLSQLKGSIHKPFEDHLPAMVAGGGILFIFLLGIKLFKFESEYEMIQVVYKPIFFGGSNESAARRFDFPYRIIKSVSIKNKGFKKKLVIILQTQSGEKKTNKFDVTFLKSKKRLAIYNSLKEIAENNAATFKD